MPHSFIENHAIGTMSGDEYRARMFWMAVWEGSDEQE